MNRKARRAITSSACAIGGLISLSWFHDASAATFTWDANGASTGIVDGPGTWNGATNWWNGTTNTAFVTVTTDAVFGGESGTPGTVTFTSGQTANSVTFNIDGYTIFDATSSARLQLGAGGVTANGNGTLAIASANPVTTSQSWTTALGKTLTIDSNITTLASQFNVGASNAAARTLTLNGSGTVAVVAKTTAVGMIVPQSNDLESNKLVINGGTLTVSARASDLTSLVVRSRSNFDGPASKVYVNAGGAINVGTAVMVVQQNTDAVTSAVTGPPGELHVDGGIVAAGAFGTSSTSFYGGATAGIGCPGVIYLNGGELKATLDNPQWIPTGFQSGVGGAGPQALYISSPGGTFNSNSFTVGVQNNLLEDPASQSGGVTKRGTGTVTFSGSNTYTGPTAVKAGTLIVTSPSWTPILSSAYADIQSGELSFDYTTTPATAPDVKGMLATGYASNFSTGTLRSSTATTSKGLGWKDDGTKVTVAYTYYGDANLDHVVTSGDFTALATNFGMTGKNWSDGDFNYDGVVNALDFNSLASNFGMSTAGPALGALVPEPVSLTMLAMAGTLLLRRRRMW